MAALPSPLPPVYTAQIRTGDLIQFAGRVHIVTHVTGHTITCADGTTIRKERAS